MNQEKGNWKPYNVKAIVSNVKSIIEHKDITYLNNPTYKFITSHLGFIAHYDLGGFQSTYQDLREFMKALQSSEYSQDKDYNLHQADRQETDKDFDEWYGQVYNKSIAEATRRIVMLCREYEKSIETVFDENEKQSDLSMARMLVSKHGLPVNF